LRGLYWQYENIGIDISKTRKHVMPKNVLRKNHASIVEVKLAAHIWWLAQSIDERNVFRFDTRIRMIVRVAATCAPWQQQNIVLPCFVLQGTSTWPSLACKDST